MLNNMSKRHNNMISIKTISWSLIAAILLVTLLPAHYHLHHLYDENTNTAITTHKHVIDLHVLSEESGQSHHDEATSISASPDGIVKNNAPDFMPFILISFILLVITTQNIRLNIQLKSRRINLVPHAPYFSPLLRAPPQF